MKSNFLIGVLFLAYTISAHTESIADPGILPPKPILDQSKPEPGPCKMAFCHVWVNDFHKLVDSTDFKSWGQGSCFASFTVDSQKLRAIYSAFSTELGSSSTLSIAKINDLGGIDGYVASADLSSIDAKIDISKAIISTENENLKADCYPVK